MSPCLAQRLSLCLQLLPCLLMMPRPLAMWCLLTVPQATRMVVLTLPHTMTQRVLQLSMVMAMALAMVVMVVMLVMVMAMMVMMVVTVMVMVMVMMVAMALQHLTLTTLRQQTMSRL